jgi:hypothetical protein
MSKKRITSDEILKVAAEAYPDPHLVLEHEEGADGLADFIRNELRSVFEVDEDKDSNLEIAVRNLRTAVSELEAVIDHLEAARL